MLPTAAYVGGPAELAYLAQSQVLYNELLGRQPVAFPRAGFTILDTHGRKKMGRYHLAPHELFQREEPFRQHIAQQLVPDALRQRFASATHSASNTLNQLAHDLEAFDPSLAKALATSRRKIEYQLGKIERKTAAQILRRDTQADNDTRMLHGLVFPEQHLQERLYSIVPFLAKFGPGLIGEIYSAVKLECPDHQLLVF